jgi:heat shock protein HslJ
MGCGGPEEKAGAQGENESTAPASTGGAEGRDTAASEAPIAGTAWRLVEFQSMDDAVGTVTPDDPSLYTMRLNRDGTVQMRLNCNRAHGTWSAEPSQDPTNGRFEFGALAATQALCPPPSMDEQIAAQAQWVRGYLLKDGRLYLSLMADGGIYAWEPLNEEPFLTEPDPDLEAAVLRASPDYTADVVDDGTGKARYIYGRVDLNGDGKDEVFVYLLGSIFCGTGGCNLLLFTDGENGYTLVNNFPISRLPVIVSAERTAGWNDLIRRESGGGAEPSYVKHTFDGERYVEKERMPGDTPPEGKRVLAGKFTFQDGIPLEPRQ